MSSKNTAPSEDEILHLIAIFEAAGLSFKPYHLKIYREAERREREAGRPDWIAVSCIEDKLSLEK